MHTYHSPLIYYEFFISITVLLASFSYYLAMELMGIEMKRWIETICIISFRISLLGIIFFGSMLFLLN